MLYPIFIIIHNIIQAAVSWCSCMQNLHIALAESLISFETVQKAEGTFYLSLYLPPYQQYPIFTRYLFNEKTV